MPRRAAVEVARLVSKVLKVSWEADDVALEVLVRKSCWAVPALEVPVRSTVPVAVIPATLRSPDSKALPWIDNSWVGEVVPTPRFVPSNMKP